MGNAAALSGLPLSHDSARGEQMESNDNGNDNKQKKSSAFALSVRMCGGASFRKKPQLKDRLRESDNIHAGPFSVGKKCHDGGFQSGTRRVCFTCQRFCLLFQKGA